MNLRRLRQLAAAAHLDLFYADESTFSMNPCLPYGWQAKGEMVGIVPQGNRKTNVFGIFNSAIAALPVFRHTTSIVNLWSKQSSNFDDSCRRRNRPSWLWIML